MSYYLLEYSYYGPELLDIKENKIYFSTQFNKAQRHLNSMDTAGLTNSTKQFISSCEKVNITKEEFQFIIDNYEFMR